MALDEEIAEVDALIEARFRQHPHAQVNRSLPGMGAKLGAEFIAATGGDMAAFGRWTGWPSTPAWHPPRGIPVGSAVPSADPAASIAG
ncbi:hypothetical protein [Streptomyces sp. NBC_00079]|uniref:hypothetical protein n=1 Tax=Streptomyces sp. NBC_00079 TaxID=2975644 RepID=UPI0038665029